MLTEEIFHDPNVRKFFRDLLLIPKNRAGYSIKPTERGLKKIDETHPYYVYSSLHFTYKSPSSISQTNV